VVSADDKVIVQMHLSGGECHDGPEGRISIEAVGIEFEKENRGRRGEGKPETYSFLDFTFYCSTNQAKTMFRVKVKSDRKKMISKLKKSNQRIKDNRHGLKSRKLIQRLIVVGEHE
jgi:hypothetical protein